MPSYRLAQAMDRTALISQYPRMTDAQRQALKASLQSELGAGRVIADRDQLLAYSYDATGERHWPDVVVLPESAEHVKTILKLAYRYRVPIVGRGASSNLSGGTTPVVGGVVVSFSRMNRIVEIDTERRLARVEPGVVNADLQAALHRLGFVYPPDPSSHRISTLGGNIAENSGGPHCVKYGVTTHHTLGLTVALADGSAIELPRVGDTVGGIDLASLVIGSEGTLALVTEAVLSIQPLPEAMRTLLVSFPSVESATRTVSALVAARLNPATLELLDSESIRIIEPFVHAGYPLDAGAVLLIEVDGSPQEVTSHERLIEAICARNGSISFRAATTPEEAEAFWRGRRAHYGATARMAPHLWVQDVTVPRPKLAEMMDRVLDIASDHRLLIVTAAHAGDGNLHPNIPYDPSDSDQVARLKAADYEILKACVELGGAITGEHGIGIDKAERLPLMYSPWELEAMNEVKEAFDPAGVLNPYKALWPAGQTPDAPPLTGEFPQGPLTTVEQVQEAMRWGARQGLPMSIRGRGRRRPEEAAARVVLDMTGLDQIHDFDPDNLSIEVGAGISAGALSRFLAREGMDLPGIEPFMDDTMGGLLASNAPYWRQGLGRGWRDVLLAAEWVDVRGRVLRFGRKTMKNVAGYDLAKLMPGSRGLLGAMTRVTLRLRSAPETLVVGLSEGMAVSEVLASAERMLGLPNRPDGILLVQRPGEQEVRLGCVGDETLRRQAARLASYVPVSMHFEEGQDAWLTLEQERLHRVYQAISQGTYQSGFLPLGARDTAALFQSTAGAVHFCPGSGWYEIMGPGKAGPPWPAAVSPEVERLRERISRVFDPEQLLR